MNEDFLESPFMPGLHVYPEKFIGRGEDIKKFLRYMPSIQNGHQRYFFVTGKKGMGKTSFVKYIANIVENQFQITSIYVNNDGNESLDILISKIIESTLIKYNSKGLKSKIKESLLNHVESINFQGSGIKFKENNEDLVYSVRDGFDSFLKDLTGKMDYGQKGILFIIDDINGLSRDKQFTSWFKSFCDTINFFDEFIPVGFCLVSYPDEFDALTLQNSSFSRIFERIIIDRIDDGDIENFFKDAFSKLNILIEDDNSLDMMVTFAFGMPLAMQQIADSIFWLVENDKINKDTVVKGIINAANEFANKQIKSILNQIRSQDYENILIKIAGNNNYAFKKSQLKEILNENEFNKLSDFLIRAKNLGIIESVGRKNSGEYQFTNRLYFVYFMIIAFQRNMEDTQH